MDASFKPPRIAIVGGGITGLAAAHRLGELQPRWELVLFDADSRLGGVIQTERIDDLLVERCADMFSTRDPWALDLCRRLGVADQLLNTNPAGRKAMVVCRGALHPVPDGFTLMAPARIGPVLRSRILSWKGKLRLVLEPFVRRRTDPSDESLESFAIRRAGRETYERIIQPLISGIYTADPTRLSMQAAMPQFVEMEQQFGSLTRALRQLPRQRAGDQESGARYGLFVAPREGMESLVHALQRRLSNVSIRLSSPVTSLLRSPRGKWVAHGPHRVEGSPEEFDGVILATRAPQAGLILEAVDPALGRLLQSIPYAGAAVVVFVVRRDAVAKPIQSFGFVAPLKEQRRILAASFSSLKFTGRAPDDLLIIRTFVGGACQPEFLAYDDQSLQQLVQEELADLIGLSGTPLRMQVIRWTNAMPQYHVGHGEVVRQIEELAAKIPGLELAGNAYHGVGIPFCIHSAELAAERIVGEINANFPPSSATATEVSLKGP